MIFTSYDFLIFFVVVFSLYWLARRRQWQNILLLVASYIFYAWVHPWYALMLGLSTLADYGLALGVVRNQSRARLFLTLSLILNLGLLGFFKYYNFFSEGLVAALTDIGIQADALLVRILLPAGLSFFTLKKLGYLIDVSRGDLEPTRSLLDFSLFVAFFPQINAGPIDRAQKLLPQIQSDRVWKAENFYSAWPLIVMGFFKKVVIADTIRVVVDRVFSLKEPTIALLLAASLGFALQILADFSAYTDLARAIARLFGFDTSENFRSPYLALTPTDFWNRWHITLSTWLRDYIFFPLRRAFLRAHTPRWLTDSIPPLVTMFVSGLWHGAGWTFVVWGLAYGVLIVLYQAIGMGGAWKPAHKLSGFAAWLVMFAFIVITFAIFRAPTLEWLFTVLASGSIFGSLDFQAVTVVTLSMTAFYAAPLVVKMLMDRTLRADSFWHDLYYVTATVAMLAYLNSSSPDFIYFQF
ncbi:MAG: MBOAT family protein [Anaerolineaceae bacterium]|nr:MAG: MBOAT family protein [Anaerolineaceae bacterium]